MPLFGKPICLDCTRLHAPILGKWGLFCDAFPDGNGIPDEIQTLRVDHRTQHLPGDHGLLFRATSPEAEADAARIMAAAHGNVGERK